MPKDHSMKILIVAANASARMGGEAFLPLKYFQILRQRGYQATLIAHGRNKQELTDALPEFAENIHYIEDTVFHRGIWRVGKNLPSAIRAALVGNALNQINEIYQKRLIRRLVASGEVDIIHQPIPVSPRAPSRIYGFGVPVVIGPMNGNISYPEGYEDYEHWISRWLIPAARAGAVLINLVIPGKRRADILLVANERTRKGLPVPEGGRVQTLVENGVDLAIWSGQETNAPAPVQASSLRLVFMGRLVDWKAVHLTIDAIKVARERGVNATLEILGDGPERARLQKQTKSLGLEGYIRFHGFKPQGECAEILKKVDALILNSLRECGGAVVLEAMSMGLPVIASDWGGPVDYLDEDCGFLVSPVPRRTFGDRLAASILDLAENPKKRQTMGEAGIRKVQHEFDWQKKVDRVLEIYHEALARHR